MPLVDAVWNFFIRPLKEARRVYLYSFVYRQRRICGVLIGVSLLSFMFFSPLHWAAVMHHSIKYGLVWWVDDPQGWKNAEYVMARWRGEDPQKQGIEDGMVLAKRVGCRPGQRLENRGDHYYCDGIFIGAALRAVSRNATIVPFTYSGTVPAGKLFLVGDSSDSYDSRYFGFVGTDQVFGRVIFGIRML
ncbi:MAG: S26 family signal peptidase [Desulfovibrio sp.]|jgi:type IV secretory pathway protease TraF|nr:S26 family signal peptidase [Desulfovibrio sp.]